MANIQSVKVIRNTNSVTIYINLDNGRFETYSKRGEKKTFTGSQELLAEAKKLALVDGKWQNWSAPRKESKVIDTHPARCPDCGGNCGANCESNMWSK